MLMIECAAADVWPAFRVVATVAVVSTAKRRANADDQAAEIGPLSLAEWVCLALIESGARHGWAIVKELEADAPIGAVWSLSPQLTYRAIEQLAKKGCVTKAGTAPGRGPGKVLLEIAPAGRRAVRDWLDTPVEHLRDVRTEGLAKLLLRNRLGLDNTAFIRAQQESLRPIIDRLLGPGHATSDLADILRRENARAAQRFLATALSVSRPDAEDTSDISAGIGELSADCELRGVISSVVHGEMLSTVRLGLDGGQAVTAVVSRQRAEALGLAPGDEAVAFIAASNVLIGTGSWLDAPNGR